MVYILHKYYRILFYVRIYCLSICLIYIYIYILALNGVIKLHRKSVTIAIDIHAYIYIVYEKNN